MLASSYSYQVYSVYSLTIWHQNTRHYCILVGIRSFKKCFSSVMQKYAMAVEETTNFLDTVKILINAQAFIRIITFFSEGYGRLIEAILEMA